MRGRAWAVLACCWALQAEGFSSRSEVLVYRSGYRLETESPWNPDNRIVRQPGAVWDGEWRPDLAWRDDHVQLSLKPRFLGEESAKGYHGEAWINEGWVRWTPRDEVSLQAGRETLLWGPGMFWNPSNPFFEDNGRNNSIRELSGKAFIRGRWKLAPAWSLEGIGQFDRGHDGKGPRQCQALKLDWTGRETHAALLVDRRVRGAIELRGYAQWTVSDPALLYGEGAWVRNNTRLIPLAAPSPTGWQLVEHDPGRSQEWVLGGAWTFRNGITLSAEYGYHGAGLSRQEARSCQGVAESLVAQAQSPQGGMALGQLGGLFQSVTVLGGRNRLGLQLREGSGKSHEWVLRYARDLDDRSGELIAQLSWDLGDKVRLWGQVMLHHGGGDGEYDRWLRGSGMLGLSWFMW